MILEYKQNMQLLSFTVISKPVDLYMKEKIFTDGKLHVPWSYKTISSFVGCSRYPLYTFVFHE